MRHVKLTLLLLGLPLLLALALQAQSPAPIIVQAASAAPTPPPVAASATQDSDSIPAAIKLLEQMKATNAEILKRQQASLEQLDEMQKAAEQLKIFSKRG
jgi:hypothetical protein